MYKVSPEVSGKIVNNVSQQNVDFLFSPLFLVNQGTIAVGSKKRGGGEKEEEGKRRRRGMSYDTR